VVKSLKFELNEYHCNIPDEELVKDLQRVATMCNKDIVTVQEYRKFGKYSSNTLQKRFGTWTLALEAANLKVHACQTASAARMLGNKYSSNQQIIDDIVYVACLLSVSTVTSGQYTVNGKYNRNTVLKRFGSWDNALKSAGLSETGFDKKISDFDLLYEIERLWIKLGRQPTCTDIKNGFSIYSLNTFSRRFGGWRATLEAFVKFINSDDKKVSPLEENTDTSTDNKPIQRYFEEKSIPRHDTNRDPNYRLRFIVMKRDSFKCCACGASPAKNPAVELHVDHITPWSKGGETTMDNLQTLCSKCNLGKCDLL
jgi:hypothetical protein